MKKKYILTILLAGLASNVFSQTKLDLGLNHLLSQQTSLQAKGVAPANNDRLINVYVQLQAGVSMPEKELQDMGIKVGTRCGSFATMLVPLSQLNTLCKLDAVKAVEQGRRIRLNNQISQKVDHAVDVNDEVNAIANGLPQCYTGKGVIAAIADIGIDFNHVNFRDPVTHKTRIKQATVYRNYTVNRAGEIKDLNGNPVQYSDIRKTYDNESDIDTLTSDSYAMSHGTHTSSTVAGSYRGDYLDKDGNVLYTDLHGVAPESDIILAGIGTVMEDYPLLDALTVFKAKQEELGEPMAINLSFGTNSEWLDGKTIFPLFYDEYTDNGNKPGVIICQAAGNEGTGKFTLHTTLSANNNHTIRTDITNGKHPLINIFSADATPVDVSIDCYKLNLPDSTYTYEKTISSDELQSLGYLSCNTYSNHDGRFAATLRTAEKDSLSCCNGYLPVLVMKSTDECTIRLIATTFVESDGTYRPFDMPGNSKIAGLTEGDATSSFNMEACTNSVLSVGAWQANRTYTNYKDVDGSRWGKPNDNHVATFSSWVEADDNGISRPDFVSPGTMVISGYNSYDTTQWNDTISKSVCGRAREEYKEGHTSIIGVMSGTSMACPNATGIMALWLQANPQLTVNQIRDVIKHTADNDDFTATAPARYGAGKINALEGLKYILKNYPTAIHEVVDGEPKGIEDPLTQKVIVNGQLVIRHNEGLYNTAGQKIGKYN